MSNFIVFDFNEQSSAKQWKVVDDVVMGGVSASNIFINENGNGVFSGHVSTKNNGGFSSVRHQFKTIDISKFDSFLIRVKGDGKNYQFRVKSKLNQYYSYKFTFNTTKDWQVIEVPFEKLQATFRGRLLEMPHFTNKEMEEICFLISNKEEEDFSLLIDYIKLHK
jgi:hypothetical protein